MWKLLCLWTVAYEQLTRAESKQSLWERVCIGRNIYQATENWLGIKLCKSSQLVEKFWMKKLFQCKKKAHTYFPAFLSSGKWDKVVLWKGYASITLLSDVQLNSIIWFFST